MDWEGNDCMGRKGRRRGREGEEEWEGRIGGEEEDISMGREESRREEEYSII
jgi:hypothetical protein